ncbi:MAG TPA: TolC family protein [Gemmatimonadaceae bacterium]|jgi:multidrug efflux system outer membrane protein|nr:TolC family protein [Gemmatimonadaceae bacterium]
MRKLILIVGGAALSVAVRAPRVVAQAPTGFWQQVGDSVLARLVNEAVRNGPSVRGAEARLDEARASHRLAAFDFAPTVTASGSALRTRQSMAQVPGLTTPLPERDLYDVGFDATWELDVFGRLRRSVSAQGARVESAEHSVDDAQVSLSAAVGLAYFELRGAQRQLAVALRNAEVQRKTVGLTEDRLAAGRGTAFDVERARSVLQLTLAAVPAFETQIASARYRIATLVGRPDASIGDLPSDAALPPLPAVTPLEAPKEIVGKRPDVLAAERQVAAQSLAVGAARADYLPRIGIGASSGYTADHIESLTRTGTSRVVFGPVVSFPLLDLGRVRQRVSLAQASQAEAETQYTAVVLRAQEETRTAVVAYDRARERVRLLTEAVKSSEHALELAQQRFEAGLTDFLQVLDAQRTSLDAESQLASAQTAASTALVGLYKATGGLWTLR